jgi:hypothetical protein
MNAELDTIVPRIAPEDLATRVKLSLAHRNRELGRLTVDATGPETIHLSGALRSFYLRQLAVATAKHVSGVRHVSDGIHVLRVEQKNSSGDPYDASPPR